MIRDFIAIDFETANQQPSSVCSVGVVMVRDGQNIYCFFCFYFVVSLFMSIFATSNI